MVTPLAASRRGSMMTWYCRSRWPQIATFATPGTAISRGRMVQSAKSDNAIWSRVGDDTPIFIARLVDESGESMTGAWASDGNCAAATVIRS